MKQSQLTFFLVAIFSVLILSQPSISYALPINNDKDLVLALDALPGSDDPFIAALESRYDSTLPLDINSLVQSVLREAYIEDSTDLSFYANKVKWFNEQKEEVRNYLGSLRSSYADFWEDLLESYAIGSNNTPLVLNPMAEALLELVYTAEGPTIVLPTYLPYEDALNLNTYFLDTTIPLEISTVSVPEPATLLLLATGLAGLVGSRLYRKNRS